MDGLAHGKDEEDWHPVLETGERKILLEGSQARYVESGHLVFVQDGLLRAAAFDVEARSVMSSVVTAVAGVVTKTWGSANYDVARDGTLVYMKGDPAGPRAGRILVWVDRQGNTEPLSTEPRAFTYPQISPDGSRIVVDIADEEEDLWLWDIERQFLSRFTFGPASDMYPRWSADGVWIAFGSDRFGQRNLFRKRADGTGAVERLSESAALQQPQGFTRDGHWIVSRDLRPDTGLDLVMTSIGGPRQEKDILATDTAELNAEISPDGRWLAYETEETGQSEVFVRPFPDVEAGKWQVSRGGGAKPLWRRDGGELFYLAPRGRMMAVPVQLGAAFAFGNATELFSGDYYEESRGRTYDVTPDGERFVMVKYRRNFSDSDHGEIIAVLNWTAELSRLVPVE